MKRPLLAILAFACAHPKPAPAPAAAPPAPAAPAKPATPSLTLAQTGIVTDWMDTSADPCSDFFAYACGGFVKNTVIPSDRATWGTTESITRTNEDFLRDYLEKHPDTKVGTYYAACVDEAAIEQQGAKPLQPQLAMIAKVKDAKSLYAAITALHKDDVWPVFDIGAQQDFKDATQMIAGLDQDGLGLPDRDYYLKDEGNLKEVREFYAQHVGKMLALAHLDSRGVNDVMRIETKIARLQQDKVTRRDPYKIYHRVERAGLASAAKTFPWDSYFAALGFPDIQAISINSPEYFAGIDKLLHEEKPAAWRNYLAWHLVRAKARYLSKAFVDEQFTLRQKLTGQAELEPRWKRCVRGTDGALGELLAVPYVEAKFAGDSKARAQELAESIRQAMKTDLETLPWMDDATRKAALEKLGQLVHDKTGYPDKPRAYDFQVVRTSYLANASAANAFELHRQLAKIGKPVDRTEWDMTAPTVNAYYNPSMNEIVLPAGELQPPFFNRDFYGPVNIGDEGANTIGHEITHGFDDEGSNFDGRGNLRDWWSPETKTKFTEATQCVKDQYSGYEAVPGVKLNGALTAGENIADIGGVKLGLIALEAWKKAHPSDERAVENFSDEKLYFLAYAQGWCSKETPQFLEMLARTNPHSPPRWRVNGPMADTPQFATAFSCKAGAPLNPPKHCAVW